MYDQHLHSRFSTDSETDPAENARQARRRGLAGLTLTDHYDSHPSEWPLCRYDYEGLAEAVARLRAEHGSEFFIGHGIEVCYQPEQMEQILQFLDARQFDLVILSVHWTHGRAMHIREHWDDWGAPEATRRYLQTVLDAVRFVGELERQGRRPFDVLGHLDMVKRYTQRFRGSYDLSVGRDLIEEILSGCVQADLIPELNTSGWRQGLPEPLPAGWIVRRYAELGGQAMTVGSDAHQPEHIAADFDKAVPLLKANGISKLAVFRSRQLQMETLG